jgi:hypothetical protein
MLRHSIGMALLAVSHRALGMFNSFTHVFVVSLGDYRQRQQCDRRQCRCSTSDGHRHGILLMV